MKFASVCSGIEAPSVAWNPLGWKAQWFSEIEAFPCAVLDHHYPDVPNLGDMTKIKGDKYRGAIDVFIGGTPCQGFSVAGKRGGLDDERSGLARHFVRLVSEIQPRWVVWENVPGAFSCWSDEERVGENEEHDYCSESGIFAGVRFENIRERNDYEAFASALVECGYHIAWRVLNAQYFGVPQRRHRIFVVGYPGDWRCAAAVLFERPGMCGNPAPCGKAGTDVARSLTASTGGCSGKEQQANFVVGTVHTRFGDNTTQDVINGNVVVSPLTTRPYSDRGCADESKLICVNSRQDPVVSDKVLALDGSLPTHTIAFVQNQRNEVRETNVVGALQSQAGMKQQTFLKQGWTVRRFTPRECERLQGFPDDYTNIPYGKPTGPDVLCADSNRYKALGNSIATVVLTWIGERIEMVEKLKKDSQ